MQQRFKGAALDDTDIEALGDLLVRFYAQANDVGALPLLCFYRCYRAMVRCKICCFRLRKPTFGTRIMTCCRRLPSAT